MTPPWKAQLGGSFTTIETAQVVQREETQLKRNCEKTNVPSTERRPEGAGNERRLKEMISTAMKSLECPLWPLLRFLSLTVCDADGIYFDFIFYLGHEFLILSIHTQGEKVKNNLKILLLLTGLSFYIETSTEI